MPNLPRPAKSLNSFNSRKILDTDEGKYTIFSLPIAAENLGIQLSALPYTHRVLLENLLRGEDGINVTREQIEMTAAWDESAEPANEIAFRPARVLLQDFTGVPAVVDLAAMRDAMA